MALFIHDLRYEQSIKVIESLGDDERDSLIKYYIQKQKEWSDKDKERIKEYESFFDLLKKLSPNY